MMADPTIDDIIKALNDPAATVGAQRPAQGAATGQFDAAGNPIHHIGVPDGYSVPATAGDTFGPGGLGNLNQPGLGSTLVSTNTPHLPIYQTGHELSLADLSPDDVGALQGELVKAGLIGPKTNIRYGLADNATISAYRNLLGFANRYGVTESDALSSLQSNPVATAAGTSGRTGHTYTSTSTSDPTFTDPATARATVRSAMQDRLGRDPTDAEFARFTKALHTNDSRGGSTTTTSSSTDAAGNTTSSSRTTGGSQDSAAPSVVADQFVRQGKLGVEGNTKMAATDYYAAAMSKLGAGGL
jgi:hypothetical protein